MVAYDSVSLVEHRLKTMARQKVPQFDAPPVNEVVFGVKYSPVARFHMAHVGLFWSQIKKEYSASEQHPPIAPIESSTDVASGLLLPRTWLIHIDQNYLIQIQQNLFFLNWRRLRESDPYPHYKNIKPEFESRLKQFNRFLESEGLTCPLPNAYELSYINLIPEGDGWERPHQVGDVLPDLCWRQDEPRFLPLPKSISWQASFSLPEGCGNMFAQLQTATTKAGERPVLRLELAARYAAKEGDAVPSSEWFDIAHEWIVRGFSDLTSRDVQQMYWRRVDGNR